MNIKIGIVTNSYRAVAFAPEFCICDTAFFVCPIDHAFHISPWVSWKKGAHTWQVLGKELITVNWTLGADITLQIECSLGICEFTNWPILGSAAHRCKAPSINTAFINACRCFFRLKRRFLHQHNTPNPAEIKRAILIPGRQGERFDWSLYLYSLFILKYWFNAPSNVWPLEFIRRTSYCLQG